MTYTTRTAEFSRIEFNAPAATDTYAGYVWMETERGARIQICHGGDFRGSTVTATEGGLKAAVQTWLRQRRNWMHKEGFSYA